MVIKQSYTVSPLHNHFYNTWIQRNMLFFLLLPLLTNAQHTGHAHTSDTLPWEGASVFDFHEIPKATLILQVSQSKQYVEATNYLLILKTQHANASGIEAVENVAKHLFENTSAYVNVATGQNSYILPGSVYKLKMDTESPISVFHLTGFEENANHQAPYVIFSQHKLTEFEGNAGHYLKTIKGDDIEALASEPETTTAAAKKSLTPSTQYAGQAIGASVLITLIGAIGLIIVYPCYKAGKKEYVETMNEMAQMFAGGALLTTAFMLIIPEAFHSMQLAHPKDDVRVTLGVSTTVLSGILTGMLICMTSHLLAGEHSKTSSNKCKNDQKTEIELKNCCQQVEKVEKEKDEKELTNVYQPEDVENGTTSTTIPTTISTISTTPSTISTTPSTTSSSATSSTNLNITSNEKFFTCRPNIWTSAAYSVLVGDFFHNFADGIAVGVAFRTCGPQFGWVVTVGAIAHEVSQEVADFLILITKGKMSVGAALIANLLSGISCIIGTILTSYLTMSDEAVAGLLGFSAGVYIWAACVECLADLAHTSTSRQIISRVLFFLIGVVCISLVLLNHHHCEQSLVTEGLTTPSAVDPHAGHNH